MKINSRQGEKKKQSERPGCRWQDLLQIKYSYDGDYWVGRQENGQTELESQKPGPSGGEVQGTSPPVWFWREKAAGLKLLQWAGRIDRQ